MKQIIHTLTILLVFTSCNLSLTENEKRYGLKHKKLLGFKTSILAELGEEKYFQLEKEVEKGKIETKYINDIIYVSFYEELNACWQYEGNIEVNNDTIKLNVILISDEVCTSTSIDKVTFLIDNPDMEKKVIMK